MNYKNHITKEMQEKWFSSIDTIHHNYFMIEFQDEFIGVISGSEIDWNNKVTKNGGIFLWNLNFPEASLSASLLLTDTSFILGLEKTYIKNLKTNLKAIAYNLALGYEQLPDEDEVFYKFVLTEDNYRLKTLKLKTALFTKENRTLKFHFNDIEHPVTKFISDRVNNLTLLLLLIINVFLFIMNNWYSYYGLPYNGNYPAFFNSGEFEWAAKIENAFDPIKTELESYFKNQPLFFEPYFDNTLYNNDTGWKTSIFKFYGKENRNLTKCIPKLAALMDSIPEVLSYGVSVLDEETSITPHHGDSDAMIRCHLPIIVPAPLPLCGIKVNNESRSWEEGKLILFCDAHLHEAWNHSKQKRIVLIIDVLHRHNLKQAKTVCNNILSLIELHKLSVKYRFIKHAPGFIRGLLRKALILFL